MDISNLTVVQRGKQLESAERVLIMLHGRGDRADSFISLTDVLELSGFTVLALQANQNTWYPFSFMAQEEQNEPYLTNSLEMVATLVRDVLSQGKSTQQLYFLGFSQGACLCLEYVTRNATHYGGVVAFTGGLIGEELINDRYAGDFAGSQIFLGSGDPDPHVPVERVLETVEIISARGANVIKKIYPDLGHTINQDEINYANRILTGK